MYRTELNKVMSALIPSLQASPVSSVSTNLKKAGLISGDGRGVSAPHIRPIDAAHTILGVTATSSPSKAVEAVMNYRQLKADLDLDMCCGLYHDGKEPWALGEILEEIIANVEPCSNLQKLVVCRTEPYAELHWEKDGKRGVMTFGDQPTDSMQVNCVLSGWVIHEISLRVRKKVGGRIDPSTGQPIL